MTDTPTQTPDHDHDHAEDEHLALITALLKIFGPDREVCAELGDGNPAG